MPTNIIGDNVRRLRVARDWSQAELAAKCQRAGWDLSRGTLAKIEARVRCVSDDEAQKIAAILGVRIGDLFDPKPGRR